MQGNHGAKVRRSAAVGFNQFKVKCERRMQSSVLYYDPAGRGPVFTQHRYEIETVRESICP